MSLFRDVILYGASAALSRAAGLLAMPILARQLQAHDYGAVAIAGVMTSLLAVIADLQLSAGMGRYFHDQTTLEARRSLVGTGFCVISIASCLVAGLAWLSSDWATRILFGAMDYRAAMTVVALQVPCQALQGYLLYVLRLNHQRGAYVVSSLAASVLGAALAIVLVLRYGLGWKGALFGILAGQVTGFVIALWYARGSLRLVVRRDALRGMLHYGLPALPAAAGGTLQQTFGQLFLARTLSLGEVGAYAVGAKASQILALFQTSFGLGWHPFLLRALKESGRHEASLTGLRLYVMLGMPLLLLVTVASPELVELLAGAGYGEAVLVLPALALAELLQGMLPIANAGIIESKRTHLASVAFGVGLFVTVFGTVIGVRFFGASGAAIALAIGRTVHLASTEWLSRRAGHGSAVWPQLAWCIVLGYFVMVVGVSLWEGGWFFRLPGTAAAIGVCLVLSLRTGKGQLRKL